MNAGATQGQDLVLGWISPGITILKRPGSKAAAMAEVEARIVTGVNGINLDLSCPGLAVHKTALLGARTDRTARSFARWPCGHWKAPPLHGARQDRMFSRSVRNGQTATKKAEPAPCLSEEKPEMRLLSAYGCATSLRLSCNRPQPPHLLHSQPRLVAASALCL